MGCVCDQNEKRQLETSMVVEQELHNTVHRGSLGDGNDETRSELDSAASDAEVRCWFAQGMRAVCPCVICSAGLNPTGNLYIKYR